MKTLWRTLLNEALFAFMKDHPQWHDGHRTYPSAMEEYPWLAPRLEPIADFLGSPQISIDPANCDSYGGPPWDHGIIIAWNAETGLTREGWGEREITNPINPKEPSIVLWLTHAENSQCLAQCLPHPKWRIKLEDDGTFRDRYHSLQEFIDLCLQEILWDPAEKAAAEQRRLQDLLFPLPSRNPPDM